VIGIPRRHRSRHGDWQDHAHAARSAPPTQAESAAGRQELLSARRRFRALFWCVALVCGFVNALMLTGLLYMLNVYDRVLGSRSVETLVALSVLA